MARSRFYLPFPQQRTVFLAKEASSNLAFIVKRTGIFVPGAVAHSVFLSGADAHQVFTSGSHASQAKGEG